MPAAGRGWRRSDAHHSLRCAAPGRSERADRARRSTASGCSIRRSNTILPVMAPVEGVMVTEAIVAQPRTPLPAVILDKKAPVDLNPGPGVRRRRHPLDPQRLRHHGRRPGAHHGRRCHLDPQRFESHQCRVRATGWCASCASRSPCRCPTIEDIADPDNSAFGPTGRHARNRRLCAGGTRWLGAHEGAGQHRVPDRPARRQRPPRRSPRHGSWLSVRPGEVLECNGCHTRSHGQQHRARCRTAARARSMPPTPARPPPALPSRARRQHVFPPEAGDTMAQARSRGGRRAIGPDESHRHRALRPRGAQAECQRGLQRDLEDGCARRPIPLRANYQSLTGVRAADQSVLLSRCGRPTCRITIHYATIGTRAGHIHPLWSVPRPAGGVDDGMGNITFPQTCTNCHSRVESRGSGRGAVAGRIAGTHR